MNCSQVFVLFPFKESQKFLVSITQKESQGVEFDDLIAFFHAIHSNMLKSQQHKIAFKVWFSYREST